MSGPTFLDCARKKHKEFPDWDGHIITAHEYNKVYTLRTKEQRKAPIIH